MQCGQFPGVQQRGRPASPAPGHQGWSYPGSWGKETRKPRVPCPPFLLFPIQLVCLANFLNPTLYPFNHDQSTWRVVVVSGSPSPPHPLSAPAHPNMKLFFLLQPTHVATSALLLGVGPGL